MYEYKATVLRVVDGDTVDIEIDLGFTVSVRQRVRLQGLNAAEHNTSAGVEAKKYLEALLPVGKDVLVKSSKPGGGDKYGRYLAEITPADASGSVNDSLVASGHAVIWDGQGAKPVPTTT